MSAVGERVEASEGAPVGVAGAHCGHSGGPGGSALTLWRQETDPADSATIAYAFVAL